MPTKRDDAAYKAAYEEAAEKAALMPSDRIPPNIQGFRRIATARGEAYLDAYTDELARRGLCASVRDWHKKPAGDELPW